MFKRYLIFVFFCAVFESSQGYTDVDLMNDILKDPIWHKSIEKIKGLLNEDPIFSFKDDNDVTQIFTVESLFPNSTAVLITEDNVKEKGRQLHLLFSTYCASELIPVLQFAKNFWPYCIVDSEYILRYNTAIKILEDLLKKIKSFCSLFPGKSKDSVLTNQFIDAINILLKMIISIRERLSYDVVTKTFEDVHDLIFKFFATHLKPTLEYDERFNIKSTVEDFIHPNGTFVYDGAFTYFEVIIMHVLININDSIINILEFGVKRKYSMMEEQ